MLKFNAPFSGTQVGKEAEGEPQQAGNKFETKLNGHLSTALLGNENRSICRLKNEKPFSPTLGNIHVLRNHKSGEGGGSENVNF